MDPLVARGLLPKILFTDLIQPAECGLQIKDSRFLNFKNLLRIKIDSWNVS